MVVDGTVGAFAGGLKSVPRPIRSLKRTSPSPSFSRRGEAAGAVVVGTVGAVAGGLNSVPRPVLRNGTGHPRAGGSYDPPYVCRKCRSTSRMAELSITAMRAAGAAPSSVSCGSFRAKPRLIKSPRPPAPM